MGRLFNNIILITMVSIAVQFAFKPAFRPREGSVAKQTRLDEILKHGVLRCGYALYPPYLDRDPNSGKLTGLSVSMMEEIGRKMSVKIEWTEEVAWDSLADGFTTNRYDAVCGPVWQTTARSLRAAFSTPYAYSILQAWKKTGNSRINSIEALNDASVKMTGVDGDGRVLLYKNKFPRAQSLSLPGSSSDAAIILDVTTGKTTATLLEPASARLFLRTNPGQIERIGHADSFVSASPLVVLLPQNEAALKNVIDTALMEMLTSGQMETFLRQQQIPAEDIRLANPVH